MNILVFRVCYSQSGSRTSHMWRHRSAGMNLASGNLPRWYLWSMQFFLIVSNRYSCIEVQARIIIYLSFSEFSYCTWKVFCGIPGGSHWYYGPKCRRNCSSHCQLGFWEAFLLYRLVTISCWIMHCTHFSQYSIQ